MKKSLLFILLCLFCAASAVAQNSAGEVRNVIYMIGDGMGLAHVSLLKIEENYAPTAFDRAQGVALISTYSANNRVTDSAAAGTALSSGYKTNNGIVGQNPEGHSIPSMMALATAQGMPTGLVVSSYLQHATPAAFYAHVAKRGETEAITQQLLASDVDVLFGGGRRWLAAECAEGGSYLDAFRRKGYGVVESVAEAEKISSGKLLCVASEEHLPKASERGDFLPQATAKALELLAKDAAGRKEGFLLMVEGSQIDMMAHANDAEGLLGEMRDFERAVAVAMDFADRTPGTLVVVVADHETGGLSLPSPEADFTKSDSGVRQAFGSKSHSATLVPVYLYGTGAAEIRGVMDNTQLSQKIMNLLELKR